jgi:hypothetical protein
MVGHDGGAAAGGFFAGSVGSRKSCGKPRGAFFISIMCSSRMHARPNINPALKL